MKSIITPIFVVVFVVLIGYAVFQNIGPANAKTTGDNDDPTMFVELQKTSDFDQIVADTDVPVLFDFHASWCGPCQTQGTILKNMGIPETAAKVVKIDVDQHPELSSRFGVDRIPTLIVFDRGEKTYQQKGLHSEMDIQKVLNLE